MFQDFKYGLNRSNLVELNLMNNKLGDVSVKYIAQAIGGVCQIAKLNLTCTKMSYKGAVSILYATIKATKLVELTLDRNYLDGAKLRVIREMLVQNKRLETLNMNECQLGEDGAEYFAGGLPANNTLHYLNLASNNFGDAGVEQLATGMIVHKGFQLKHLDLSNNFVSDEAGKQLAVGLAHNHTLLSLSLAENTLTEESGLAILETMKVHPVLSRMDLSKNLIPIRYVLEIHRHCERNNEKTDPKQVPRLVREHESWMNRRISSTDFQHVAKQLNHYKRLE